MKKKNDIGFLSSSLNCSNCLLCFLWICTMIWFYSSLPKGKKKHLTCVTFGILCFNGFALCPVFLRDNTTVRHVCATDLKISQLWVLLALMFIIYWVMQYVTVIPVYKARYWDKDPPSPPHSIYFCWWSRRPGEFWELSQLVSD